MRILIVEDDVSTCILYRSMLDIHNVDTVHNGEQALTMLMAKDYHLILIDLHLPAIGGQPMSGIDILRLYKNKKEFSHIPSILISAHASNIMSMDYGLKDYFKSIGFASYLPKPISKKELLDEIKEVMDETA